MAPRSKIDDRFIATFCSHLRISGSVETAIKKVGIGRETFYGWVRAVKSGRGTQWQKRFFREVEEAESEVKLMREHMLTKHFDKNWVALAWWLERKYPNEYGQRKQLPDVNEEERTIEGVQYKWVEPPKELPAAKTGDSSKSSMDLSPVKDDFTPQDPASSSSADASGPEKLLQ
jgi:16S rRNA C967 or C1407 C5-methylase (RsmB/RsmF family)